MIGFPIAFSEGEFVGQKGWFAMDAPDPDNETMYWPKWFFQWSFASATCTIVSGAGAERCSFLGYLVSTFLLSSFVYPIVVHSMWSDQAWLANVRSPPLHPAMAEMCPVLFSSGSLPRDVPWSSAPDCAPQGLITVCSYVCTDHDPTYPRVSTAALSPMTSLGLVSFT